jgi:hypothetical protein
VSRDTNPVPSTLLNLNRIPYHQEFVPENSQGSLLGKKSAVDEKATKTKPETPPNQKPFAKPSK